MYNNTIIAIAINLCFNTSHNLQLKSSIIKSSQLNFLVIL